MELICNMSKPMYKTWWFFAIVILFFIVVIATSGEDDVDVEPGNEVGMGTGEDAGVDTEVAEQTDDKGIKAGTYKVGTDILAGEYLIISEDYAYIEVSKDSTGDLESIIFNENLMSASHMYATIREGEYLKVTGATIYPVDSAPSIVPKDGVYRNGQYKVGSDIPAGEYKYTLDSSDGFGYIEVNKSSDHDLMQIVSNDNPEADGYITVSDGQYLSITNMYIETK